MFTSPTRSFIRIIEVGGYVNPENFHSRVFGTHATFVIRDDEVDVYGEDAAGYDTMNFFGS